MAAPPPPPKSKLGFADIGRSAPSAEPQRFTAPQPPAAAAKSTRYAEGAVVAGKYKLVRLLGEGGMASVWLARNLTLDSDVAVKFIRSELATAEASQRLLQEARAAARLVHPSIVRVFDFGESERRDPFIVMEVLTGRSLAEVIDGGGPLPPETAVQIFLPVVSALSTAHLTGIVHRDLKPDNIFLAEGQNGEIVPKLLDFGIAKFRDAARKGDEVTKTGVAIGSPDYMSPEQARGKSDVDQRADVWGLSVVLYEAIAGVRPFNAVHSVAMLMAICNDDPPSLSELGHCDAELWRVIGRGLEKDRDARWPTMREYGKALAAWADGRGVETDVTGTLLRQQWLEEASARRSLYDIPGPARTKAPPGFSPEPAAQNLAAAPPPALLAAPPAPSAQPAAVPPVDRASGGEARPVALASPRSRRGAIAAALAAVAVAFVAFTLTRSSDRAAAPLDSAAPPATHATPSASASAPLVATAAPSSIETAAPSAVATAAASAVAPPVNTTSCAAALFAEDAFQAKAAEFAFLCGETDPRKGAAAMKAEVVRGGGGKVTAGMKEWYLQSFYDLATFAIVRGRCCPEAAPLALPAPVGTCEPLAATLDDLARNATAADVDAKIERFAVTAECTLGVTPSSYSFAARRRPNDDATLRKTLARIR